MPKRAVKNIENAVFSILQQANRKFINDPHFHVLLVSLYTLIFGVKNNGIRKKTTPVQVMKMKGDGGRFKIKSVYINSSG